MGTRSSFLSSSAIDSKHSRSIFGWFHIIFIGFLISIYIVARTGMLLIIGVVGLIFGILFIINGWAEFSLLQTLEDIPTTGIGSAAEGLCEVNGTFVSDKGDALTSPILKKKCIYYQIDVQYYYQSKNSSGWRTVAVYGKGAPALLTDKTGYLAVDLADADLNFDPEGRYFLSDKSNKEIRTSEQLGRDLIKYVMTCKDDCDISTLGVYPDLNGTRLTNTLKDDLFGGAELCVVESIIPVDMNFFAVGRVATSVATLNDQPIKMMVYDPHSKLLSVRQEGKDRIVKKDKTYTYLSFGLGVPLLLLGLFLISNTSSYNQFNSGSYTSSYYTTIYNYVTTIQSQRGATIPGYVAPPNTTRIGSNLTLTFVAYGSDHPSLNNKQSGMQDTVLHDGVYGNLTTHDPWVQDDEGANWTWDFGSLRSGDFVAVWYANDVAGDCGSYPTGFSVAWYVSTNATSWVQFAGYTFSNYGNYGNSSFPMTSSTTGTYRYVRLSQYSPVYGMACPGVTYVDTVYVNNSAPS
jgi:hypothetical protein